MVTEQVVGRGKASKVQFAVAAGERRRRAMLLLQQRGRLPKSHEVLCELVPPERAREVSVAENSGREALHPADEFDAFKALIDEGKGGQDVAVRWATVGRIRFNVQGRYVAMQWPDSQGARATETCSEPRAGRSSSGPARSCG